MDERDVFGVAIHLVRDSLASHPHRGIRWHPDPAMFPHCLVLEMQVLTPLPEALVHLPLKPNTP
eukprot:12605654-Prorocentrum_lima.AAC.1